MRLKDSFTDNVYITNDVYFLYRLAKQIFLMEGFPHHHEIELRSLLDAVPRIFLQRWPNQERGIHWIHQDDGNAITKLHRYQLEFPLKIFL